MKVSEARKKVCPFMSITGVANGYDTQELFERTCICSACMAWEFTETEKETNIVTINVRDFEEEDKSELTDKHIKVYENTWGEYYEYTTKRYAILEELSEGEKDGFCRRLK